MIWYHISLLLCLVGFLKDIRPSEPFVSDYMQEPYRNVTKEELNRYIYPIATYANVIISIAVLLITDWLRYKPIIILMGLSGILTWTLMIWTRSFFEAQLIEVCYALYSACEVAYFAYIYAKVSKEHFLAVSSHTRAALMFGRFLSGFLAQTLIYYEVMNIHSLNYLTLAAQIAATSVAIFLPTVNESIYFYRNRSTNIINASESHNSLNNNHQSINCVRAFALMWKQLECAYTNRCVILWSLWYACGMCIYLQFVSYVQLVWIAIDNRPEAMWNGAVESLTTLLSAGVALLSSHLHASVINTKIKILAALFVMSLGASAAIFLTANASNRFVSYAGYLAFYAFYIFTITVSSAEIAKELPEDSYGLIFGVNTFFAICLQSVLTILIASDAFEFNLNIFQQMNFYGVFLTAIGFIYFLLLLITVVLNRYKGDRSSVICISIKKTDLNSNVSNGANKIAVDSELTMHTSSAAQILNASGDWAVQTN